MAAVIVLTLKEMKCANSTECPICFAEFKTRERVAHFRDCYHIFHRDCIIQWYRAGQHPRPCPVCRVSMAYVSTFPYIVQAEQGLGDEDDFVALPGDEDFVGPIPDNVIGLHNRLNQELLAMHDQFLAGVAAQPPMEDADNDDDDE